MKRLIYIIVGIFILLFIYSFMDDKRNDFYDEVNHEWLVVNHIEKGDSSYSNFTVSQDKVDKDINDIVLEVVSGKKKYFSDRTTNNINVLYDNARDSDERNRIGLGPIYEYLSLILNCHDIDDFKDIGIRIERELNVPIFSNYVIDSDFYDNDSNIVYFYPMSFAFGSSSYMFVDLDYISYKAYIKRGINELFQLYGYSRKESSVITNKLMGFYEEIGNHSYGRDELDDVSNLYHLYSLEKLGNLYSSFNISDYLKNKGISSDKFSVVDIEQIKYMNDNLVDSKLELWKYYGFVQVLSYYANYLSDDYYNVVVKLNDAIIGDSSHDDFGVVMVKNIFSSEIDSVFSKRVIFDSEKKYLNGLFSDLKSSFKDILIDNKWLDDETRKKAIDKLDNMNIYVGNDSYDFIGDELSLSSQGLIYNIIDYQQLMWKKELEKLDSKDKRIQFSDSVVNAYYRPQSNAVYVPSAFWYLVRDSDNISRLGSIGMILSHEITHGFDDIGSRFDSDGNYHSIWNDSDQKYFTVLRNRVIDYYSSIEVYHGRYISGERTVNENIADLGALQILVRYMENHHASRRDYKKMFSSFARFWASQDSDNYIKLLLLLDSHSPNKYRVNAVLSSTDKYYDIYHVRRWNKMYRSDRVRVW